VTGESGRWLDVGEAARELGTSSDAIRKRIARGTLPSEERDGRRVVWLDDGGTEAGHKRDEPSELVEALRSQVDDLREQLRAERDANRENRRLLAAALERMPALESGEHQERSAEGTRSSTEPSGVVLEWEASEDVGGAQSDGERRPWWRRLFG
jgi:hypothetical protein